MTTLRCPLPTIHAEPIEQGVRALVPKCRACGCGYPDSDLDSDRLPAGCILTVVALLEVKREVTA